MISLLSAGDTDILRDASQASSVFWFRVKHSPGRLAILGGLTAVLLTTIAMMLYGPEMGMPWATPELVAIGFSPLLVIWLVPV